MTSYDGNLFFLDQWQNGCDRWLESLPTCAFCKEPIQDEYVYRTNRGDLCEECARSFAEELAEDFIRDTMEEWRFERR